MALKVLGSKILNNMATTLEAIKFCHARDYCYRFSSDLFPLITYDKTAIDLREIPDYGQIESKMAGIKTFLASNNVRISTHPDQFNVLASENEEAVNRTIKELNFQSWFMDQIGCPADHNSPINLHINNNKGKPKEIIGRLKNNMSRLDPRCRARIVFENDDKPACWSVKKLMCHMHEELGCPITFDYLHHKCHPDGLSEEQAIRICYETWNGVKPLFHYSESKDEKSVRSHADYPSMRPETYGLDFDLDFEFKMKDKAIAHFQSL